MTTTLDDAPDLGEGIYSFPQAAAILSRRERPVTTSKLRYWMNTGLAPASYALDRHPILTFYDLISLEVVARFVDAGWSVQGVRLVEDEVRKELGHYRPFAYKFFYTNGASLWMKPDGTKDILTELISKGKAPRDKPLAWTGAIETFAEQLRFEGPDLVVSTWDLSPWIEINPTIQFGTPVVRGTRVPASTVLANLEAGTPGEVADWYDLKLEEVHGVRDYYALN